MNLSDIQSKYQMETKVDISLDKQSDVLVTKAKARSHLFFKEKEWTMYLFMELSCAIRDNKGKHVTV